MLVGEVLSRAEARRAACSKAQAATGTATVTNATRSTRLFILIRICTPPTLHKKRIEVAGSGG
jgi:hypothetical protein